MRDFLITLLECSVSMSVLILGLAVLTPWLSKKYSAKLLYYVWLVIVVGLIIPFRFHPNDTLIHTDSFAVPPTVQQMASDRLGITKPAQKQSDAQGIISGNSKLGPGIISKILHPWYKLAGTLWILGVVIFITFHSIRHRHFLQTVRRWSQEVSDRQVLDIMQAQKIGLNILKRLELRTCICITSPMMIGLIKPVILLPPTEYSEGELSLIIRHELVHLKRRDLWFKILIFFATAIHWFNPIIYLMAKTIAKQCEISCDIEVVKDTDMDKRQMYSEAILNVIKNKTRMHTAFSTNFYGGKKEMKNRIFSIMDKTKKKTGIFILCTTLIMTLGSGTVFAAGTDDNRGDIKPLTEYGGAIITYYNPYSALEANVLRTLGKSIPGSKVQIEVTSLPDYIDVNGRKIDTNNRTEPYYCIKWNWMSKDSEAKNFTQETLNIEGKNVTLAFSDKAVPFKDDKVIEKMLNNMISFASVYKNKTYDYDYKAFINELIDKGICVIQEVTTPDNFGWDYSLTKDTGFWASRVLTKYDEKDKVTSVYNGKITVRVDIDGNQGVQIGNVFTIRAGETLTIDIKETTDDMPKINWEIVDVTLGKTIDWRTGVFGGNRYVWTPSANYMNHTFKVMTSTACSSSDQAYFEIFTYKTGEQEMPSNNNYNQAIGFTR